VTLAWLPWQGLRIHLRISTRERATAPRMAELDHSCSSEIATLLL